jgi:hypothetical protein
MKSILKSIGIFFTSLFKKVTGKDNDVVFEVPKIAVSVETINHVIDMVNNIKRIIGSPAAVLLTDLIPGTLDNKIRLLLLDATLPILAGLTFSKKWLVTENKDVLLLDLLNKVSFSDDADKDSFYHSLAARLIVAASDGKVTWSESASLIELYFKHIFAVKSAA